MRLMRLLQKQHLPLVEIARRMKALRDSQVDDLIAEDGAVEDRSRIGARLHPRRRRKCPLRGERESA
jgi:hypothetical protein